MTKTSSFDDRLAAAFGAGATSASVAALIEEAEAAAQAVSEAAERARARALDPALSTRELADAKREMDDAAFARDRLQAAVPKLQERRGQLLAAEEDARRRAAYDQAKVERDRLAAELAKAYPELAAQLTDLLARLRTVDQRVEQANAALPPGCPPLLLAELIARRLPGFARSGVDIPRLTRATRLPAFDGSGVIWPPAAATDFDPGNMIFNAMQDAFVKAEKAKAAKAAKTTGAQWL